MKRLRSLLSILPMGLMSAELQKVVSTCFHTKIMNRIFGKEMKLVWGPRGDISERKRGGEIKKGNSYEQSYFVR